MTHLGDITKIDGYAIEPLMDGLFYGVTIDMGGVKAQIVRAGKGRLKVSRADAVKSEETVE